MRRRLFFLFAIVVLAGCATKPRNPQPAAFSYPNADLAAVHEARYLRYEGRDIGLDGGSDVYILSTPERKKVALWNFCMLARRERGYDPAQNAIMLKTGSRREDEHPVEPGGELEAALLQRLDAGLRRKETFPSQHRIETEILAVLRDRHHVMNTFQRVPLANPRIEPVLVK